MRWIYFSSVRSRLEWDNSSIRYTNRFILGGQCEFRKFRFMGREKSRSTYLILTNRTIVNLKVVHSWSLQPNKYYNFKFYQLIRLKEWGLISSYLKMLGSNQYDLPSKSNEAHSMWVGFSHCSCAHSTSAVTWRSLTRISLWEFSPFAFFRYLLWFEISYQYSRVELLIYLMSTNKSSTPLKE